MKRVEFKGGVSNNKEKGMMNMNGVKEELGEGVCCLYKGVGDWE